MHLLRTILTLSPASPFMTRIQEPNEPRESKEDYPFWVLVRRSLARRFPRTRIAYNWTKARIRHLFVAAWNRSRRFFTTIPWAIGVVRQLHNLRKEPQLTVGVDIASFWEPLTGVGWALYRLLEECADAENLLIRLFPPTIVASDDIPEPVITLPSGRAIEVIRIEVPPERVICAGAMIRSLRRIEPFLLATMRCSVMFAPNFYLPNRFKLIRSPLVATIHDLGSIQVPWTLRDDTLEALTDRLDRSLSAASELITVSRAVRAELLDYGYAYADRVHAIHHGPGHLSTVEAGELPEGLSEGYGLHVGTLEPRKNVETLIAAWERLARRMDRPPNLILCGQYGWKSDDIRARIEAARGRGHVLHLGYIDDAQLAALYKHAGVVILPSLYEGFGLPAVEALYAGAPLICSDIAVLREVAGPAALFVPADRADLFAEAIEAVLNDPEQRRQLVRLGALQASKFSWKETADQTIGVWRRAAGAKK